MSNADNPIEWQRDEEAPGQRATVKGRLTAGELLGLLASVPLETPVAIGVARENGDCDSTRLIESVDFFDFHPDNPPDTQEVTLWIEAESLSQFSRIADQAKQIELQGQAAWTMLDRTRTAVEAAAATGNAELINVTADLLFDSLRECCRAVDAVIAFRKEQGL